MSYEFVLRKLEGGYFGILLNSFRPDDERFRVQNFLEMGSIVKPELHSIRSIDVMDLQLTRATHVKSVLLKTVVLPILQRHSKFTIALIEKRYVNLETRENDVLELPVQRFSYKEEDGLPRFMFGEAAVQLEDDRQNPVPDRFKDAAAGGAVTERPRYQKAPGAPAKGGRQSGRRRAGDRKR